MDLTRPVLYRGYDLNDAVAQVGKPGLTGRSIEVIDVSAIVLNQYADKTSQADGMDFQGIGNLEEGVRQIEVRGTLYAPTRPELWDALVDLRLALDPVQSYASDEANDGYLPLSYSVPTASGVAERYFLARSTSGLLWEMDRDQQGTNAKIASAAENVALALPWRSTLHCRDPRSYGEPHTISFTGSTSGSLTNGGDYPTLVDITLVVGAGAGSVVVTINPNTPLSIIYAAGGSPRVIRYRGFTKLLTVVDPAVHATHEILRQDWLSFGTPNSDTQHPLIQPGAHAYTIVSSAVSAGSKVEFTDAWA